MDAKPRRMNRSELAEAAHAAGIDTVEHLSTEELIEAVGQQEEANAREPVDGPPAQRTRETSPER